MIPSFKITKVKPKKYTEEEMAVIEARRDAVRAPTGREVEPPRDKATFTGRGGLGNIHQHYRDPDLFHRVITHERGIIQSANEKGKGKVTFGRGGLGNRAKKKEPLVSDAASIKAVSVRTVGEKSTRSGGYGRGGYGNRPKKKESVAGDAASQKTSSTESSNKSRFFFKRSKGKQSIGTSSSSSMMTMSPRSSMQPSLLSPQSTSFQSTPLMTPTCSTPVSATFSQVSVQSDSLTSQYSHPEGVEEWEPPRMRTLALPPRRFASPPNFARPLPPQLPPPTRNPPPGPIRVDPAPSHLLVVVNDDEEALTDSEPPPYTERASMLRASMLKGRARAAESSTPTAATPPATATTADDASINTEIPATTDSGSIYSGQQTEDNESIVWDGQANDAASVNTEVPGTTDSGSVYSESRSDDIDSIDLERPISDDGSFEFEPADDESVNMLALSRQPSLRTRTPPQEADEDADQMSLISLDHEMPDLPEFDHDFNLDFDFYATASRFPVPPTHDPYTNSLPANISRYSLEAVDEPQLPHHSRTPIPA